MEDVMNNQHLITRKLSRFVALFLLLSVVVSVAWWKSLTGTGQAGTVSSLWS